MTSLEQFLPPLAAGGFVGVRWRSFDPDPHVTLHGDHKDQSVNPQSTAKINKNLLLLINFIFKGISFYVILKGYIFG